MPQNLQISQKPVIMLPGGQLNRYSISMYGISAIRELEQVNFHQTFLGVTGYSMKAGFTCGNNEEAMLKRTAIEQAEQVVVLMDSSKNRGEEYIYDLRAGGCGCDHIRRSAAGRFSGGM